MERNQSLMCLITLKKMTFSTEAHAEVLQSQEFSFRSKILHSVHAVFLCVKNQCLYNMKYI